MKRLLLMLAVVAFANMESAAQCTPNPLYNDSLFGVWPDTTENFPPGLVGVFYTDTMNIIVPMDGGDIDPAFAGQTIDSVQLNMVTGLPPGLSINCNSQTGGSCTLLPAQLGCVLLEGTPTQSGAYPITIDVTAWTTFIVAIPVPYSFTGYNIDVGTVGLNELQAELITGVSNVPNPFESETEIRFDLSRPANVQVQVFDLLGQKVFASTEKGTKGSNGITIKGDTFEQGIYIYQLTAEGRTHVGRMVLDR